ncbi:MAG TPA: M48 family metalloprotease [Spirochaetia bacterium]|nr:M48 family metalloprotease [Spirochaetia bacterium]
MKSRIRFSVHVALLAAVALGLSACASMDLSVGNVVAIGQGVQQVQQAEQTDFTPEQEYYIGRAVAANLLQDRTVYDNAAATDYLNVLERGLAIYSDRPETFGGYHVAILDSAEINAFAAPGGLILVTRGLLRCATSEDGVAAILAHETSHVVLKHGLNAIKQARKTAAYRNLAIAGANTVGGGDVQQLTDLFKDSIADITNTLVNNGYSRDQELQADQMALGIMRAAGYNPQAFDDMLKLMKQKLKVGGLDFAKTHPDPKIRSDAVEKTLAGQPAVNVSPEAAAARQARYQAALGTV